MKKKFKRLLPQDISQKPKEAFTKSSAYISAKLKPEEEPPTTPERITNETVAEHREEMLTKARKYIYPLQHSKHKIVVVSVSIFLVALISFFSYSILALYKFQKNSTFLYRVTQVVPFPVARTGSKFISYESYLFELRHYIHYYQNQQKLDFNTEAGAQQLEDYKRRALERVIDDAYVKQLAEKNRIEVTNKELDEQIAIVRNQNRLGASDKSFETTLKDNFGWSVSDFRRSLKQQLLAQKVASMLDKDTKTRADFAYSAIKGGLDFPTAAQQFSDDISTKDNGGEFGFLVDKTNPDLPARTTETLFKLAPGQVSEVINIGYSLEILKNLEVQGDKIKAAHILFNYKDINEYLNPLKDQQKTRRYIRL